MNARSDRWPAHPVLLALILLVGACEGSAKVAPKTKRPDAGAPPWEQWMPPPQNPFVPEVDGGRTPPTSDGDVPQVGGIPQVGCTAAQSPCGSGKPPCCTGAICASYPNLGMRCGQLCKANDNCPSGCCVSTSNGTSVCAPSTFCPGGGTSSPDLPPTNPTPSADSCAGHCGDKAPGGCWCDVMCAKNGDCCTDAATACNGSTSNPTPSNPPPSTDAGTGTAAGSCAGHCGDQAPSGCWCDVMCAKNGDCCTDAKSICSL